MLQKKIQKKKKKHTRRHVSWKLVQDSFFYFNIKIQFHQLK